MQDQQKPLLQVRRLVHRGCNTYLAATEKDGGASILRVYFSRDDTSSDLNELFRTSGRRGILEGREHYRLDMVLKSWHVLLIKRLGLLNMP